MRPAPCGATAFAQSGPCTVPPNAPRRLAPARAPLAPRPAYTLLYIGMFLFLGVQMPFFPGFLEANGFSATQIGELVAIALVLRLVLVPVFAFRVETLADPRLGIWITAGALSLFGIILALTDSSLILALTAIAVFVTFGLMTPIADAAVLRADRRGELAFGPVRGIGSTSFIAANLLGGVLVFYFGDPATAWFMALAAVFTLAVAGALPREKPVDAVRPRPDLRLAGRLFRSPSFLLLVGATGMIQGAHAVYYAFSELHWARLGYSSVLVGVLWTIGVAAEIVLLLCARQAIARLGPTRLLILGGLGAVIRWPLTGMAPPLPMLIILQLGHALTYAATYIGTVEFMARAVPERYRTTAMAVNATLGSGLVSAAATMAGGRIFDTQGPFAAYVLMAVQAAIGLGLAYWLHRRWHGGTLRAVGDEPERAGATDAAA